MTAAQQAQQHNRHRNGEYAEKQLADPGQLDLGCSLADEPELDEFEWVRIESMIGTSMHLDPERTVSVPKMSPDDNIAQMTRKMMNYVAKTQKTDDLTDADIADMVGLQPSDEPMPDRLRFGFDLPREARIVTGIDSDGRPVYLSTSSDFKRTGHFRGGFSAANLSQRLVAHQFADQFADQNPDIPAATVAALFRRLEDKSITGKRYEYLWDEDRFDKDMQMAIAVAGGDLSRIDTMTADEVRTILANLPQEQMPSWTAAGKVEHPAYLIRINTARGLRTGWLRVDHVEAELAGTTERARRAAVNRAYRGFLEEQVNVEYDYQLQRGYVKRNNAEHTATVFEQKKNVPQSHLDAADRSYFKRSGDFKHVEVDEQTDLDKLHQVEAEWSQVRSKLPRTGKTPDLRFRLTGRHKAHGVYHPHVDNIAVDPRHPDSFLHEFVHHVDHTAGEKNVSSGDDFRPLLRQIQKAVAASDDPRVKSKSEYLRTPTEVLSRSAEVYYAWKHPGTSLNGTADGYADHPFYSMMEPMRAEIIKFWDAKLAELGVAL